MRTTWKKRADRATAGEDVEQVQGFLGRYLRRNLLQLEVNTRLANLHMPEAIQWLLRIYCNLFIFVRTASGGETSLSPQIFLACPVESTQSLREQDQHFILLSTVALLVLFILTQQEQGIKLTVA